MKYSVDIQVQYTKIVNQNSFYAYRKVNGLNLKLRSLTFSVHNQQ